MTHAPLKRRESAAAKPQALKHAGARAPAKRPPAPVTAEPEVQRESSVRAPELEEGEAAERLRQAAPDRLPVYADDPPRAPSAGVLDAAFIQRKCDACDQEDEEALDLQRKPLDASPASPVPGLRVGSPNDPLEREADRFADAIVDDLARSSARGERPTPRPEAPTPASTDTLQRACDTCATEPEEEELQREVLPGPASASGMTLSSSLSRAVHIATRGGAPLPFGIRRAMEPRFGVDLGSVRVHTGAASQQLNRQLHARAFTLGPNIFFGADQFRPNDRAGQKLIAHELTHTLQQRRQLHPILRRAPESSTSAEVDTADAVIDEFQLGLLAEYAALERRIRKLSRLERQRLRDRIHGQSWEDPALMGALVTVLDNVEQGHTGASTNTPTTVPCNPGDVEPVSVDEWEDDPVLTDLELTDGTVVAQGKLGGHSPSGTITLFQRALVQWGCEVASPARNPLRTSKEGDNGVDGFFGPQFRRAVRQFQDHEGLPVNGVADPATVQRMAWWLDTDNTRRERETNEVAGEAAANLAAEKAASAAATAEEDAVQRVLYILHREGARHIGIRRPTSPALAANLVASRISGASPEAINEALERILLVEPEFYHQILFEGKLIAALQDFGIHGLEVAAKNVPRGADFPVGFAIEARDLTARDPHSTPIFSGTDIPLIATGFFLGTGVGVGKAVAENLEAIAALVDPEFWVNLGKIATDPEFRYILGRGAAEALHKKIAGILASSPYDYGVELGTLFGMLVFEFAVAVLLAGGSLPLKLANRTDDIKKAGRLQLAARYVANSAVARTGVKVSRQVAEAAVRGFEASAEFVKRVRRLLPDITQHARASRAVDDVAALELAIERKLEAFERSSEKRFYLHQRPSPDPDHLDRLDLEIRRNQAEINELLDAYGPSNFDDAIASRRGIEDASRLTPDVPDADAGRSRVVDEIEGSKPHDEPRPVDETKHLEGPQLTQREIDRELQHIRDNPGLIQGQPPNRSAKIGEHEWIEQPGGGWCRHSDPTKVVCALPSAAIALKAAESNSDIIAKTTKVAYYLAKEGITDFEIFLERLKLQKFAKNIDFDNLKPEQLEAFRKAFKAGTDQIGADAAKKVFSIDVPYKSGAKTVTFDDAGEILLNGKPITREYDEIYKNLGLNHVIKGHGPNRKLIDVINEARQDPFLSGKFTTDRSLLDAVERAKTAYKAKPERVVYIELAPSEGRAFARRDKVPPGSQLLLPFETPADIVEVAVRRVRAVFRPDGTLKTIFPIGF